MFIFTEDYVKNKLFFTIKTVNVSINIIRYISKLINIVVMSHLIEH